MIIFKVIIICTLVIHEVFCDNRNEQLSLGDEGREYMSIQERVARDMAVFNNYTEDLIKGSMSCEEFVTNYTFDVSKIIDVDWRVFYFWTTDYEEAFNLKFSMASKVLVDRYRVELDKELKEPIIWEDALLFMEASADFSGLIIKTKTEGIFKILPSQAFHHPKIDIMSFAIKIIEPYSYLAIINCKFRLGYALAPSDKMPQHGKNAEEAEKIGFYSKHGKSYLDLPYHLNVPQAEDRPESHDDDNEDMHFEYERQINEDRQSVLM